MNKNYLQRNFTKLFLALLLIISALIIHSCKKDASTNSEEPVLQADSKLISEAQNYFTKEILPQSSAVKANEANAGGTKTLREFITKGTAWDKAYIQDLSFGKTVVVPITYGQELYIRRGGYSLPMSSLTWLIIYADKDKKQHVELVTKVPDAAYVNGTDSTRAYTGYILVEDFQGNFIKGYKYLSGGVIQQIGAPSIGVKSDSNVQVQSLECTTTDYYSCGPTQCTYTDTETICVVMDDNGPGGGDSGGYPGVGSGGGGAGSGTIPGHNQPGPTPCPPVVNESIDNKHYTINSTPCGTALPFVTNITNSVNAPCLNAVVTQISSASPLHNAVTNVLVNTFGVSVNVNISFSDAYLGSTSDAETSGSQLNNIDVVFNSTQLTNATKEYLAETTMHEIYHAYLDVNPTVRGNLSQHLYMVQNYVTTEVGALKQQFPNLSDHDAKCLVLGGYGELQAANPEAFNAALSSYNMTINDIVSTNNKYKTGQSGTKCQ